MQFSLVPVSCSYFCTSIDVLWINVSFSFVADGFVRVTVSPTKIKVTKVLYSMYQALYFVPPILISQILQ